MSIEEQIGRLADAVTLLATAVKVGFTAEKEEVETPKPEPVKVKTQKPKPKPKEETPERIFLPQDLTLDQMREKILPMMQAIEDGAPAVSKIIEELGADTLSNLPTEKYSELLERVEALKVAAS